MISGSLSPGHGESSGFWIEDWDPLRRVVANILNKQSRRADKGWSSSWGVGRGAYNSSIPLVQPKQWKRGMRFGTWNVRSLYRSGSLTPVTRESTKYKLDIEGVQ